MNRKSILFRPYIYYITKPITKPIFKFNPVDNYKLESWKFKNLRILIFKIKRVRRRRTLTL